MNNVVDLKGQDVDVEQKLLAEQKRKSAMKALARAEGKDLLQVVVIGRTEDGMFSLDTSEDSIPDLLFLLEVAKGRMVR